MFKQIIDIQRASFTSTQVQFIQELKDIRAKAYMGDYVALTTSRALLGNRLDSGKRYFSTRYYEFFYAMPNDATIANIFTYFGYSTLPDNDLTFITTGKLSSEEVGRIFNGIKDATIDGFVCASDIDLFFSQQGLRTKVFINEEKCKAVVFCSQLTVPYLHLVESLFPRYFPKLFKNQPLTESEIALLVSLTQTDEKAFLVAAEQIFDEKDYYKQIVKSRLQGYTQSLITEQAEDLERRILNTRNVMKECLISYSDNYKHLQEMLEHQAGLFLSKDDESDEILKFFLSNKNIKLEDVTPNGVITFTVKTHISNYNIDLFDRLIKNPTSAFYRRYGGGGSYDNKKMSEYRIKRLMNSIFKEERLRLMTCAAYSINLSRGNVQGHLGYQYDYSYIDYVPNMHIDKYACLGNNAPKILDAIQGKKYALAIQLCMASAANMNMTESNTISYFMEYILGNDPGKCIEMPDGSRKTPLEAVIWLENEEKEQEGKADE